MIDKSNYISLLIEHKSSPSEYIFFQLLGYLANGYLTQLKNKSDLHPIIPIIYYQGEKEWKVKNINHVFDDYPESIKKYLPDFRYIFVALHQMSEESLLELRNSMLYSALMLQMHRFEPIKMIAQFEKIITSFPTNVSRNFLTSMIVYSISVSELGRDDIIKVMSNVKVNKNLKSEFMSTYDQIVQYGEKRGEKRGIKLGELNSKIKVILNAYDNNIKIEVIANITNMTLDQVKKILIENGRTVNE